MPPLRPAGFYKGSYLTINEKRMKEERTTCHKLKVTSNDMQKC